MGLYSQYFFPWLCDWAMDQPFLAKLRCELLANVDGRILEIGMGTGLNLPHYPKHVHQITTVDPNSGMHRLARRRIKDSRIEVDHRMLSSERLPFDNDSFDCVVSTWTLCSIDDVRRALSEIHRVLKPGGRFLFLEHGLSPEARVQKWQRRLNWLEQRLADGCRLDRNMRELICAEPFAAVQHDEFYLEDAPKTHGYMYRGTATK